MKKILLNMILLFVSVTEIYGQELNIEKQFKSLQINSSPAYVILGVEPENIQRPNSPIDFTANVQSALVNERLQPNFALETSPYFWSKPKADSSKFDMVEYLAGRNYWQNLAKSLTLSFATSSSDSTTFGTIPTGTGMGFGMHVQLIQGGISKNTRDELLAVFYATRMQGIIEGMINSLDAGKDILDLEEWLDDFLDKGSYKNLPVQEKNNLKNLLGRKINKASLELSDKALMVRINNQLKKRSQNKVEKVNEYQFPLTREGFMLELSVANARIAENSDWDKLTNAKTAIWLTPSYRFNINKDPTVIDFIDLMAVARLTMNSSNVDTTDYIDVGGKLQWLHNRVSFSAEAVLRYLSNKPQNQKKGYTSKTGFTFSYKLNDLVTFKTTMGSNFDGNSTQYSAPSKMSIVGGFNFGFSNFF